MNKKELFDNIELSRKAKKLRENSELKTLKELIEFIYKGRLKELESDVCFIDTHTLRQEAIKRIKSCNSACSKNFRCKACERDMWFYDITEGDLK